MEDILRGWGVLPTPLGLEVMQEHITINKLIPPPPPRLTFLFSLFVTFYDENFLKVGSHQLFNIYLVELLVVLCKVL